jgi:hypothetical protein
MATKTTQEQIIATVAAAAGIHHMEACDKVWDAIEVIFGNEDPGAYSAAEVTHIIEVADRY